ncbi:MAG: prepilin-type N-terminal cleavage/methylation domain-containing protein [Planctomycetales bacterium]|nr:prepilin-type N-terminal cleavage/methylation domain-containing protein [Planctomycetales bacterium]
MQVTSLQLAHTPRRQAFTLVELLVVISIVTLLASMVLVALAGVQETARVDRTRAQIARIDTLVMEKWDGYKSRRFAVPQSPTPALVAYWGLSNPLEFRRKSSLYIGRYQVDAVRELMRMELPDRQSDVLEWNTLPGTQPSALWLAYRNKARKLIMQKRGKVLPSANDPNNNFAAEILDPNNGWTFQHQAAECLYLILSQINDRERSALEFFSETEIGDTDSDGIPEILDAWGQPIVFARWAPGLQIPGSPQDGHAPDPFDLRAIYFTMHEVNTFALYPLIASSGPDRQLEIFHDNGSNLYSDRINYAKTNPPNNPYLSISNVYQQANVPFPVGSPLLDASGIPKAGYLDNITNQNLAGS